MTDKDDKQADVEEKPKRRRRAKAKPAAEKAAAAAKGADAKADAEEKPKRRTRAKAGTAGKAGGPAAEPAAAKPKAEAEAKTPPAAAAKTRRDTARGNGAPPLVRAHAKYVRSSARKARLVCDHIRGKDVEEARAILEFTPRAVARDWSKLLESAVANAEHNHELIGDELRIAAVKADEGPTLKRFRPRAMGRATKILKRTSHLSITLTPKPTPRTPKD